MTSFIQEPPDKSSAIQYLDFNLMKLRAEKQVYNQSTIFWPTKL